MHWHFFISFRINSNYINLSPEYYYTTTQSGQSRLRDHSQGPAGGMAQGFSTMIGAGDGIKHLLVHALKQKLEILNRRFPGLETDFRSGGLHTIRALHFNTTMACRYSYIYYEVYPGILSGRQLPRGSCLEKSPRITGAENVTGAFLFEKTGTTPTFCGCSSFLLVFITLSLFASEEFTFASFLSLLTSIHLLRLY